SSNISEDKFITLFYCLLDAAGKKLIYTNAGHNAPILIRRDGSALRLESGGTVLGPFPESTYDQEEVELRSGDRVLLFTEGITEALNSDNEEFGEQRLINLLVENREADAAELQSIVMDSVDSFSGGDFQDDATLIALSVE